MMKIFVALVALCLGLCAGAPASAQMRPPVPLTAIQLAGARAGQPVQLAVKIDARKRTALRAHLLEQAGDEKYTPTTRTVELYFPDGTPIVMGSPADVSPGAVIFVYGVATKPWKADVKKVIVMTNYVKVR